MPDEADPRAPEYRSVLSRLRGHAERMPDKICLHAIDQGSEMTWGQLYRVCNQIAGALSDRGIGANDRVVVLTDNSLENLILYYGIQRHGATFCTVNVDINREHLGEIIGRLAPFDAKTLAKECLKSWTLTSGMPAASRIAAHSSLNSAIGASGPRPGTALSRRRT